MSDSLYAIRSKEGTAVINTEDGCVQVFETWEQAVIAPKRKTDEIVAVTIKRIGSDQEAIEVEQLREQLAKANERVIDSIIEPLFKARWSGDLANSPVSEMRDQLFKTLRDQTMGYWSGHTAYNIAVDGGFLINDKKGANKRLTSLGAMFVEQEQLRKGGEA